MCTADVQKGQDSRVNNLGVLLHNTRLAYSRQPNLLTTDPVTNKAGVMTYLIVTRRQIRTTQSHEHRTEHKGATPWHATEPGKVAGTLQQCRRPACK